MGHLLLLDSLVPEFRVRSDRRVGRGEPHARIALPITLALEAPARKTTMVWARQSNEELMGSLGIWYWLIVLMVVVTFWGSVRIVRRTGRSCYLALLLLVPIVNAFAVLWFSHTHWAAI